MMKFLWAVVFACLLVASSGIGHAQSLGEIARQQRAKRGTQAPTGKVYTNDTIPHATSIDNSTATSSTSSSTATEGTKQTAETAVADGSAQQGSSTASQPEDKKKTKEYWQAKFGEARAAVARADEELSLAKDELNLAQMNEARELDPNLHNQLSQEVTSKQAAASEKQAADDKAKQALEELKKEFDESGAPKDWMPPEPKKQ